MNNSQSSAYFIALDCTTWVAYRDIAGYKSNHTSTSNGHNESKYVYKSSSTYQKNRQDVRKLLLELLSHLKIKDTLCEDCFPYRLKKLGYFVCFSHSTSTCAVILSQTHSIGIDVETQEVPHKIAQRHFSRQELDYLANLPINEQKKLIRRLWQLKECLIKINQQTLFVGLKTDFSFLLPTLQKQMNKEQLIIPLNIHNLSGNSILTHLWIDNHRNIVAVY